MTENNHQDWKRITMFYHSKVLAENKIVVTGKGNLLPLISENDKEFSLIIIDTKVEREPFTDASPQEQLERFTMKKSEPVVAFTFPKTKCGLSSVIAMLEWLEEIKEYFGGL